MTYEEFLKGKQIIQKPSGFEAIDISSNLFNFQNDIVEWASLKGKSAVFADCGLGKTVIQVEWANQVYKKTDKNVLILAPLGVTIQTKDEAKKLLGLDINICRSQQDVKSGINITNYERIDKFEPDKFIGIVLDESSILKSYTGPTRTKLTKFFQDTPYKMCCTATPAPNDYIELLSHAEFLNIMSAGQALGTWFINDMKTGTWRLKGHAIKSFWEWVSTWAVYIKFPSDLGYSDEGYKLPKLNEILKIIDVDIIDHTYENGFIRNIDTSATGYYKEKKIILKDRVDKITEIVNSTDEQYIVWCYTNDESKVLKENIMGSVEVKGNDKPDYKEEMAQAFKSGNIRVLISKASIFGYGMNFQKCRNAIFCGLSYSFEDYYQAVKRLYRFGQTQEVNNYIVLGSTEKNILDSVRRKQEQQLIMEKNISNSIRDIQLQAFKKGHKEKRANKESKIELPDWMEVKNAV